MEVILLEKIGKLGSIGDKANVKAGYGRNYLVPQGKAVFATEQNMLISNCAVQTLKLLQRPSWAEAKLALLSWLRSVSLTITAIAGDEGKLFGSVGIRELEDALNAAGGEMSRARSTCQRVLSAMWVSL